MIKALFTALLILVFAQNALPQAWQWINTYENFILYDISFPSGQSSIGYAVGSSSTYEGNGVILKTTDGGFSWFKISVGTIPGLEGVAFTSTNVGYAGGWQNYFIKTTDGGATWSQINIAPDIWYFKEIEFWDANHGIASAQDNIGVHVIYVTSDAGNTWTKSLNMNQGVEDICYVNQNTLYIAGGDEKVSRSTDGGLNWTEVYSGVFQSMFFGVEFYNANYGIVGGEDGKMLITTNGGANWTISNAGGYGLMSGIHIFNEDSAYVVGTPEQVYKTTDGGLTWGSDFNGNFNEAFYKVKFTENGTGIICSSGGKFLIKTDSVIPNQEQAYAFNGAAFSYGYINLTTGLWHTMNFNPQGNDHAPVVADNVGEGEQYAIMADFSYPTNFSLWYVSFSQSYGYSIGTVGPLATGQTGIRGMAYNKVTRTWYVISSDEWVGAAAYLYTLDIMTGALTQVGQIQNANQPVGMAIDCDGTAYIVNVNGITGTAVLNSLDLATAVATPIGTDLGLAMASTFAQDMDFDPDNGNLYWAGYWSDGWFAEGGSFRLVDVTTGTSTELAAYGQFENLFGFNVNGKCSLPPAQSYAYNGGFASYGQIDLTSGFWDSWNFNPGGYDYYPVVADNKTADEQYTIMSDWAYPPNFSLWHINFSTLSGENIGTLGPLSTGQTGLRGMAYNKVTDTWYVISSDEWVGTAAYLYTLDVYTGTLTQVGQIQNANQPVGMAIDCDGTAYIVNVNGTTGTAVLNSLDLASAVATPIGTDLGLAGASTFAQDMDFDPDNGSLYWAGYWTSGWFSEGGSFRLIDVTTGTSTELAPYEAYNGLFSFSVKGICSGSSTFQLSVNVNNGWNMVSIPGLNTPDQNVNTWWSYRDMGANVFKYAGGYQSVTAAEPGTGYWLKHTGARTYNTGDEWPSGGIQIVPHDPITAVSGWNLFGGYEISATTALVTTVPAGLQSGPIYRYSGGYQTATTIDPGYGYWIKLTGAGQIIIPEALAKGQEPQEWFPENWGRIVITDATGISYTLYTVKGEVNLNNYELPPAPPAGMFDIRFNSGRIAEDIISSVKTIDLSGVEYPLTVNVENMDIRLMDETGKKINVNLNSGENTVISNATITKLMVSGSGEFIPAEYSLKQNYPNPFNPSTTIEFSLPEDVTNAKLSIYNVLGEKVAELVNTSLVAGTYRYQWNASNVATGMYLYELRTDKFVSVQKMLLLK